MDDCEVRFHRYADRKTHKEVFPDQESAEGGVREIWSGGEGKPLYVVRDGDVILQWDQKACKLVSPAANSPISVPDR